MKRNLVGKILGKIKIFVQDFVPIRTALRPTFMGDRNDIKNKKVSFCGEFFVNGALWAPKHGNSDLQKLLNSVGGCFSLPTYRILAKFCRGLDKFSSPQK